METLANKIKNDKNVKGIKVDKKELKIRLLSDAITLLLAGLNSVKALWKSLNVMQNVEKT